MILNNKLERKKLPADSKYYDMLSYVDNQGKYIHSEEYKTEKKESEEK